MQINIKDEGKMHFNCPATRFELEIY